MIPKALSIFIFSITIQQLATYTTRRIDKDLVFYEWDDYLTRTTNRAQRLEWLQQNMIMLDVIPDLVYEVPQDICEVTFYDQREIEVKAEVMMFYENITSPPTKVHWDTCDPKQYYILTFTAPDDEEIPESHHIWFLANIYNCSLATGDSVFNYQLPVIGDIAGYQRFVFLIFKQPHKIHHFPEKNLYEKRINMSLESFVMKYNMTIPPAAGNFFYIDFSEWNYRHYTWTTRHYSWFTPHNMSTLEPTRKVPRIYPMPTPDPPDQ